MGLFTSGADFDAVAHGIAGALGGMVAIGIFFPLDSLRTRLQAADAARGRAPRFAGLLTHLVNTRGLLVLYQGLGAVLITTGVSNFVYFCLYSFLKVSFADGAARVSPVLHLILASIAGIANVLITTPLWLVNTRMKVQQTVAARSAGSANGEHIDGSQESQVGNAKELPYRSLVDGLVRVFHEEGPAALWDGTSPSLILVSNPAIQWAVYETLRAQLLASHAGIAEGSTSALQAERLLPYEYFFLAAAAKTVATLVTYPLQMAQTRLRNNYGVRSGQVAKCLSEDSDDARNGNLRLKRYAGTVDCLRILYRTQGLSSWYRGLDAKMLQTVLTAAFHISCYEEVVQILHRALRLGHA